MMREGRRQRFDAVAGQVVKGSGKSASGHGYNPYRSGGKFASGPHKEKPKGPGRAPGAKAKAPARAKFNAEPHKQVIAANKALETHHRGESLRLAGEMKALKEQAKATKPRSAERASLKEQHGALKAQRDEHKAKATASRTERIAASKEMQAARKEHAAGQAKATTESAPPAKAGGSATATELAMATAVPASTEPQKMNLKDFESAREAYGKTLTSSETDAALAYSSYHAVDINRALRTDAPVGKYGPTINDLDSAISKSRLDRSTVVYRGISEDPIVFAHYAAMKPGDVYTDRGYTSTSFHEFGSLGGHIKLHITVPAGGRAAPIPSVKSREGEFLLPRNSKFRVDKIETKWDGGLRVHVTALPE